MGDWRDQREARRAEWHAAGGTIMSAGWTAQALWAVAVFAGDVSRGGTLVNFLVHLTLILGTIATVAGAVRYARYYGLRPEWAWLGLLSAAGTFVLSIMAQSQEQLSQTQGFEVKQAVGRSRTWRMMVTIRLTGAFAESVNGEDIKLDLPKGAPISAAVRMIGRVLPEISDALQRAHFAVNNEAQKLKNELNPADVLVISP